MKKFWFDSRRCARVVITLSMGFLGAFAALNSANAANTNAAASGTASANSAATSIDGAIYQVILSEIALQRGQLAPAYSTYSVLAREWRDARLSRRATEIAVLASAWDQALDSTRQWAQLAPNDEEAQNTLLVLLVETGRLSEAEPIYAKRLAESTNKSATFEQIQTQIAPVGNKAEALAMLDRLASTVPDTFNLHLSLARAAMAAQNSQRALQEAQKMAALDPRSETAALLQAQLLIRSQPTEAQKVLSDFVNLNPQSKQVRFQLARLLLAEEKYEAAHQALLPLLSKEPKDLEALFFLGTVYYQERDLNKAKTTFDDYLQRAEKDQEASQASVNAALLVQAEIAQEAKNFKQGIAYLKRIESGEQYFTAQLRIAHLMAKSGQLQQARDFLHQLPARTTDETVQIVAAEALLLRDAKQPEAAYAVLAEALKKNPDEASLLYDYALSAEKIGKLEEMERRLRRLMELRPKEPHAYNALGYSWADRNMRLAEALTLIEKAHSLAPNEVNIIDSLGWVHFRLNNLDLALQYLERAYELEKNNAELAAHFGEVLWSAGQRERALEIWRKAYKKDPDDAVLTETLKRLQVKF